MLLLIEGRTLACGVAVMVIRLAQTSVVRALKFLAPVPCVLLSAVAPTNQAAVTARVTSEADRIDAATAG